MADFYCDVMGQPTINRVAGVAGASGDNTLIAAPGAGNRLAILYEHIQNESATATTAQIKHGSTVVARKALAQYAEYERDHTVYPVLLPENTAYVLNLSGANNHGYTLEYTIVPV